MNSLPPAPLPSRPIDRRSPSRQTNTPAPCASRSEHGCIPQHVRNDEEAYMAASNVDLVEMADTSVARGDGDVFELDVHVVFGYVGRGS